MTDVIVIPTVTNADSAHAFLAWAVKFIGGGFHPDTRADDYIKTADGTPTFNASEQVYYENQIQQVFRFLPDPYAVTIDLAQADEQARLDAVTATTDPEDRIALVFAIDVTNLTVEQRNAVEAAVSAQLDDGTEDYPAVTYESSTLDHDSERDILGAVQVGLGL